MEIRDAVAEDAPAACQVLRRSIEELCAADHRKDPAILARWLGNKTPEIVRSWIDQPGNSLLVAVEGEAILAVGSVTDAGKITLNYVAPDARFRRVSRALLGALEARAMERGNTRCTLTSTETARRFYHANGYVEGGSPTGEFGTSAGYPMSKTALLSDPRRARASLAQGAPMKAIIREMRPEEARVFLEVHHAAVRGLAAKDYSPEVIDAWAPLPIRDEHVEKVLSNPDGELRLVAEIGGEVVGIGSLLAKNDELRACYVAPRASRRGVGSALARAIELAAREQGVALLHLDSSTMAEPFYAALGYEARERGEHILGNGRAMACVKMRKRLLSRNF